MFSLRTVLVSALLAGSAIAMPSRGLSSRDETHTISFVNKCGKGTPQLVRTGQVLSTGQPYTHHGVFDAGIAYLQTGECGLNGDKCTTLEMTLKNPPSPGAGSSTDVTLIPPHAFNVGMSFAYQNGCDGQGKSCPDSGCHDAFRKTDDYFAQTQCETNNVNLVVTFC